MNIKILILLLFIGHTTLANESTSYIKYIESSVTNLQELKNSLKAGDKKFCKSIGSFLQSDCVTTYLSAAKIKNSTEIALLSAIIVGAAVSDKKQISSPDAVTISMLQNLLVMMEKVDTKNFYLSQRTTNPEVILLRSDDEKMLANLKKKLIDSMSKPLGDVTKNSANNSLAEQIGKRIDNLKSTHWKY